MGHVSESVERVLDTLSEIRQHKLDLSWMDANPSGWGTKSLGELSGLCS